MFKEQAVEPLFGGRVVQYPPSSAYEQRCFLIERAICDPDYSS